MHFSSLFISQKQTMCPANNCLQIMVCSSAILSNCILLQTIFYPCVIETTPLCKNGRSFSWAVRIHFFPFSDFKSLKTVNLFLKLFSFVDVYIMSLNGWLCVQCEVERIKLLYLTENSRKPIYFCHYSYKAVRVYCFLKIIMKNKLSDWMIKQ